MSEDSASVKALLDRAQAVALRLGHDELTIAHVLLSAFEPPSGRLAVALSAMRVDSGAIRTVFETALRDTPLTPGGNNPGLSAGLKAIFGGRTFESEDELVVALLSEEGIALQLRAGAIDAGHLLRLLCEDEGQGIAADSALAEFCVDLTALAHSGRLDPVVGREEELALLVETLMRRFKNNPLLVGEPGVGKSALLDALAESIKARRVPTALASCRLLSLDLGQLLAGTRYRGEFEARLKRVISEIEEHGQIILFIDEVHMLVGAGGVEGSADAANLLKPALARGALRCVGATTPKEYRMRIERDAALSRRFQLLFVEEPSPALARRMVEGLRERLVQHHGLGIETSAVEAAVRLGVRYLPERRLPDKALDLLDQAGAMVRARNASPPPELQEGDVKTESESPAEVERKRLTARWLERRELMERAEQASRELRRLEEELRQVTKERRFQRVAQLEHQVLPAARLKAEECASALRDAGGEVPQVGAEDVAQVVQRLTGISVAQIQQDEAGRLVQLELFLAERVVAQPTAVSAVSRALRRARAQLQAPGRPLSSMLLVGPTGVGKTALSKAVAEFLFNDERALLRFDMSEYQESHSVARLIGAPPGYVGHEAGGELTNQVRRRPFSVLLFDEVEKAHPDIYNSLLQVLDEGHLMDSSGVRVDFKNTLIMMTSNLVSDAIDPADSEIIDLNSPRFAALHRYFRPEFLNRVDEIVPFRALVVEDLQPIVRAQIQLLAGRLEAQGVRLNVAEALVARIATEAFQPAYGARPIQRFVQRRMTDPIADLLVRGELKAGRLLCVDEDYRLRVS